MEIRDTSSGLVISLLIDGKIILTTAKEELVDGMHDLKVLQVDVETGEILWIKTVLKATEEEGEDRHPKNSLASPTPAIEDGVIYAHFGHMGTVALDFDTGETLWKQKISYTAKNGAGGTPIIVDDKLVFTTDSVEEPVVTALYKKTGEIAWRTTRSHQVQNNFSHGTPLLIDNHGRKEIISPQRDGRRLSPGRRQGDMEGSLPYGIFHVTPAHIRGRCHLHEHEFLGPASSPSK